MNFINILLIIICIAIILIQIVFAAKSHHEINIAGDEKFWIKIVIWILYVIVLMLTPIIFLFIN